MKLDNLHKASPLEMALKKNVAVKSMLQPLFGREYYWKDFDNFEPMSTPEPAGKAGPINGGHYDTLLKAKPRLEKYFGGPNLGPM